MEEKTYLCIDLKSFYASVECAERGLDAMTTNLVVADPERTEKTICLAVSPSMKKLGVKNRCRLFQIPSNIEYIIAVPRMQLYIDYSAEIYSIYLKYISKEDIYPYSIDECFLDVTHYLNLYQVSAQELGQTIMDDIMRTTKVPASCGIGTNLYLTKIALDITAKHAKNSIGYLDEELYQKTLWNHTPLTDFWRVGPGIARRLQSIGILTMGDLAHANEDQLYRMFGVDAELLIDHAWGREPVTMADIKNYKSKSNSISSGQVLPCDYNYEDARLVIKEMTDLLCLDLVEKDLLTDNLSLMVGYSNSLGVRPASASVSLAVATNSISKLMPQMMEIYDRIVNPDWPIRRMNISFNHLVDEAYMQYDLFSDPAEMEREKRLQKAAIEIKKKFGKNAILKGMNLEEAGTTRIRNQQIGGHRSEYEQT